MSGILEQEYDNIRKYASKGRQIEAVKQKDGTFTAQTVRMGATGLGLAPPIQTPLQTGEAQTKEQTAKEFGPALAGVATGPAVGAAEVVDLGLGLVKGAYKAAFPDADESRFESFMQTLGDQFESGYGEGARSMILDIGKRAGYDEEQLKVMDEGITAGSFFGYGGAVKAAPKAVSKIRDNIAKFRAPTQKEPGTIAFHGSGADFDEFQVKYIGTGEGAQAYGYGLYFTESEDIAKYYRDTVANQENIYLQLNGKPIDSVYTQDNIDVHGDFLERNFEPDEYDDALMVLDNLGQGLNTIDDADAMAESSLNLKQFSIYEKIRESLKEPELAEGKMYKVSIEPKPEDMIDYQTTFADQPKKIQDALKAVGYEVETNKVGMKVSPSEIRDAMRMPMAVIIDRLKKQIGSKELSEKLLEQGVPGIKYRAAGSRGANVDAADAKMNYVVFDDKMIKILEKYGIVGPVAITGVAATQQEGKSDGTGA